MKLREWLGKYAATGAQGSKPGGAANELMRAGLAHHRAGEYGRAQACCFAILENHPDHPDALCLLGEIACLQGRNEEAVERFRIAVALQPGLARVHRGLGHALQIQGDLDAAVESFRRALTLDPGLAEVHLQLGDVLRQRGRFDEALDCCLNAVELEPGLAQTHNNLGNAYADLGRAGEAIAAYRKALELDPGLAEAHLNLGMSLHQSGKVEPASVHYRAALAFNPGLADAHLNLGYALEQLGDPRGAIECYRQAISLDPHRADAHFNLALQLLLIGEFAQGWEEYEWRWQLPGLSEVNPYSASRHWDGSALAGETILLYAEQGFGDAIQFVRYAPLAAKGAGKVIVRCQPELQRLFERTPGISKVVSTSEPIPDCDLCCSLLSLPRLLGTMPESTPAPIPYLRADPGETRRWHERIVAGGSGLKVGLVWASQTVNRIAQSKSLKLEMLAPLAAIENVAFYSLQKGAAASEAGQPPRGMRIVDASAELGDFSDTAALIANLDLVISVDTAVAHLAGAMGRRVWTLTHFPPVWRWMLGRDDSPWYPTMRLFRQRQAQDWMPVVAQVAEALKPMANRP